MRPLSESPFRVFPDPRVIATIPGGKRQEKIIRHTFRGNRIRGEWYRAAPGLL